MARCPRVTTDDASDCTIFRCPDCGNIGCSRESCHNQAFGAACLGCGSTTPSRLKQRRFGNAMRWRPASRNLAERNAITESLAAKYLGLLAWLLAICGTRMLPAAIADSATTLAFFGFVGWFIWESGRTHREVQRQLNALATRRRAQRDRRPVASVR